MKGEHRYVVEVEWTGNQGAGTAGYNRYQRDHIIRSPGKPDIEGCANPGLQGKSTSWSPEDLLVASISACHQLWYLHCCAAKGIRVETYWDDAVGTMREHPDTGGAFTSVLLRPIVTIQRGDNEMLAHALHEQARHFSFITNSVNFPITCDPRIIVGD